MTAATLDNRLEQARQLISRLERVSADSVWAHRSSGYRGSLLKWIDQAEKLLSGDPDAAKRGDHLAHFERLHAIGLDMLAQAARESLNKRSIKC